MEKEMINLLGKKIIEIDKIKQAICEIYETIRVGGFTPELTKLVEEFRKDIKEKEEQIIPGFDYSKLEYTREWFDNNQAHTIYDITKFKSNSCDNIIHEGNHFLLDLYPIYENGEDRCSTDVEIWEVELTNQKFYDKKRKDWFDFRPIRKITTGKQFGYPNGYWKVKEW